MRTGSFLTAAAVADRLGLGLDAVYDLCRTGALPHRRIGPRRGRIAISEADLATYLESARVVVVAPERGRAGGRVVSARPDGKPFRFL